MTTDLDHLMSTMYRDPDKDPDATAVNPAVRGDDRAVADEPGPDGTDADTDADADEDDDLFDEDALTAAPRTSRVTIALVALLLLVIGFLAGVEAQQLLGAASGS